MMTDTRAFGADLTGWTAPRAPDAQVLAGRYCTLERLDATAHSADLFAAFAPDPRVWDYMPHGPFSTVDAIADWVDGASKVEDPMFYAVRDHATGRAAGVASYLRIFPATGVIELGWITLGPALQRTRAATETFLLMIGWAFDAGYRRFEWKCDALNLPSRRAAIRLGLSYEGVFRQATIYKNRNRDTAWFAAIDTEWPALKAAYDRWLDPANFDAAGDQRISLSTLTAPVLAARDPALTRQTAAAPGTAPAQD